MRIPKIYNCTVCEISNYDYYLTIKTTTHYECPNFKTEIKIRTEEK